MSRLLRRWGLLAISSVLCLILFVRFYRPEWNLASPFWTSIAVPKSNTPRISWETRREDFPISKFALLPTEQAASIPSIQFAFPEESTERKVARLARRDAVKAAFEKSWKAYSKYAWMHDELAPLSMSPKETFGGWGASLVDALDTLWIMGLEKEFTNAVAAVEKIDFTRASRNVINVFETTIRYLGGLLSAYDVSGGSYPILLEKAEELGHMLYASFDTPNRMPLTRWYWETAAQQAFQQSAHTHTLAAEIASLSLEFTRLAQLTGQPKFYDAISRISDELEQQQDLTHLPGLWPIVFDAANKNFTADKTFTLGGMADSLYEYLPKEFLLLGGTRLQYRSMYEKFVDAAKKHLFFRPNIPDEKRDVLISGTARVLSDGQVLLDPEAQHLTCFLGGVLGIGSKVFDRPDDLVVGKRLTEGCIWAYETAPNGIMPELFRVWPCKDALDCPWDESEWLTGVVNHGPSRDSSVKPKTDEQYARALVKQLKLPKGFTESRDVRYILRPEAIESVWILYRITGDTRYQDVAWKMFTSIKKHCETRLSFAALGNVMIEHPDQVDSQESFWMAETLKYFYLIFSEPDLISLDDYVLNTEAHPLLRPKPSGK